MNGHFLGVNKREQKGGLLVFIIIICGVMAAYALVVLESSVLQLKMAQNFQSHLSVRQVLEKQHGSLEETLNQNASLPLPPQVIFKQFVPDTLHYGERLGTNYYYLKSAITQADTSYQVGSTYASHAPKATLVAVTQSEGGHDILQVFELNTTLQSLFKWEPSKAIRLSEPVVVWYKNKPIIYVLGSDLFLYGFTEEGELSVKLNLAVSHIVSKNEQSNINPKWERKLLAAREITVKGKTYNILTAYVPQEPTRLIAWDVSDLFEWKLLWQQKGGEPLGVPHIVYLCNGKWVIISAVWIEGEIRMTFFDLDSGTKLKEITLGTTMAKSSLMVTVADLQERGIADAVYIQTETKLWKLELHSPYPQDWRVALGYPFAITSTSLYCAPMVGRHPDGKGALLYVVADAPYLSLLTVNDLLFSSPLLLSAQQEALRGCPVLKAGYLVVPTYSSVKIFDAFTEQLIREKKWESSKANDRNFLSASLHIGSRIPKEKEQLVILKTSEGMLQCKVEIDYGFLGRRTWSEGNT